MFWPKEWTSQLGFHSLKTLDRYHGRRYDVYAKTPTSLPGIELSDLMLIGLDRTGSFDYHYISGFALFGGQPGHEYAAAEHGR